jgi:hypothetical protein
MVPDLAEEGCHSNWGGDFSHVHKKFFLEPYPNIRWQFNHNLPLEGSEVSLYLHTYGLDFTTLSSSKEHFCPSEIVLEGWSA